MVGLIHQRNHIDVIPFFKFVNTSHILTQMPDGIVRQTERNAQRNVTGHTMRDERDCFAQMLFAQIVQQRFDAQAYLPCGFAAGKFHLARLLYPLRVEVGIPGLNVLARHPFPRAVINVEQVRRLFDVEVMPRRQGQRGLNCAGQGTRVDRGDFVLRQAGGNAFRLQQPFFVQRHIRTSAKTVLAIPFRFAVTDEDKAGTNSDSLWDL